MLIQTRFHYLPESIADILLGNFYSIWNLKSTYVYFNISYFKYRDDKKGKNPLD